MHHKLYIKRRESRMKQKEVAKLLRISPVTYCRKETGKLFFTLPEAIKLAEIFECTLNDLFQEEGTA